MRLNLMAVTRRRGNEKPVGCGDQGTASGRVKVLSIDAVRQRTASYRLNVARISR